MTMRFKLPLGLDLRMAATKGIARPSFKQTVGFADLRPTRSTNYDVILEHYSSFMAGVVSAGFFYKEITDVAQEQAHADYLWDSPDGQIEVETMLRYENIGKGFVKGIELSLQKQLDIIGLPQVGLLAK